MTMNPSKIAVITGGSRGLGRAAAEALAEQGTGVVITYHSNEQAAHEVLKVVHEKGVKGVALRLDVANTTSFAEFTRDLKSALKTTWGRETFDALLNNAGIGAHAGFMDTTEEQFDHMSNIHLKGPFFLTQALVPLMEDGGRILNVSSGLTRFSFPGYAAYATMKGGIEVLTHYLAKELGPRNISVNTLAPGAIATDFGGGAVRDNKDLNHMIAGQTALGRVGESHDIGPIMASLLSDDTRWINAQRIEASGGMLI